MMWNLWAFVGSVVVLALGLPIFSYVTLIYRELGRMTTGRVHEHLEIFEAEIEPKLKDISGWHLWSWRQRGPWCTWCRTAGKRAYNSWFFFRWKS